MPGDATARFAFSERADGSVSSRVGDDDAPAARERLAARVGLTGEALVFMRQVHGGDVAVVGRDDRGRGGTADTVPAVDALVTFDTDVAVGVIVADCVPLLLVDPGRAVAAVHAGREGMAAGVVPAAVRVLTEDPGRVTAVIGPAIGGCCYEVPQELVERVAAAVPEARTTTTAGTPGLDLPAGVSAQLADAGVDHVRAVGACTRCHPERFFSHRASAAGHPPGRQAGVVVRHQEEPSPRGRRAAVPPDPSATGPPLH